jgi:uncharacterized membrane protein
MDTVWYNQHRMRNLSVITNRIIFILSLAGAGVSVYLTMAYMKMVGLGCSALYGCASVAEDPHSWGFGIPAIKSIPTPAFGLAAYLILATLSFMSVAMPDRPLARIIPGAQFAISGAGVAVSAWLTYLEAYVIHAWCQWCLMSAAIILIIFLTAGAECINAARAGIRSNTR